MFHLSSERTKWKGFGEGWRVFLFFIEIKFRKNVSLKDKQTIE